MRGIISWNGKRSDQYGIEVVKYPSFTKPKRKMDIYTVPGRNGDIIMLQDAWENVEQKYEIIAGNGEKGSIPGNYSEIADWLYSPEGYSELWDDFDPKHFRLAYYAGELDVDALSEGRIGKAIITFSCKPQRYLIDGRAPIEISSVPASIFNHTEYNAKPLLFIEGYESGGGSVSVNGTIFSISNFPENGIYIDCEELNCYDVNGMNMNSRISSSTSEFATLRPGKNAIGFTGDTLKVSITPRWFEI